MSASWLRKCFPARSSAILGDCRDLEKWTTGNDVPSLPQNESPVYFKSGSTITFQTSIVEEKQLIAVLRVLRLLRFGVFFAKCRSAYSCFHLGWGTSTLSGPLFFVCFLLDGLNIPTNPRIPKPWWGRMSYSRQLGLVAEWSFPLAHRSIMIAFFFCEVRTWPGLFFFQFQ